MEENNFSNQNPQQPQNINQPFNNQFGQMPVPNSTAVLVLGILSIVFCFCYGLIGLTLGIIALVLASKGNTIYQANPSAYSLSSFNNMKAGKICGIIGVSLSALYLVFIIIYILILGAAFAAMPWDMMNHH
ncbi:MAG TPA: CCC motif membrane protein [Bacteroidia bacterium]|nr:CCC motif membrane protein [Bacteroidia bacterium]